jgi:glucose-6-phosphate 1-dehydrogenase
MARRSRNARERELAWGLVDPILRGWEEPGASPPLTHAPGTWGPPEAEALLGRDGRTWFVQPAKPG